MREDIGKRLHQFLEEFDETKIRKGSPNKPSEQEKLSEDRVSAFFENNSLAIKDLVESLNAKYDKAFTKFMIRFSSNKHPISMLSHALVSYSLNIPFILVEIAQRNENEPTTVAMVRFIKESTTIINVKRDSTSDTRPLKSKILVLNSELTLSLIEDEIADFIMSFFESYLRNGLPQRQS